MKLICRAAPVVFPLDGSVIISHTDCGPDCRIRVVHGRTFRWQEAIRDVRKVREPFEDRLFMEQDSIDAGALALCKKDPDGALDYLTGYSGSRMEEVLGMYNRLRDQLIVKYSNSSPY